MKRLTSSALAQRTLVVLWAAWLVVLPLGHVTGLRNTLAVLTIVATLAVTGLAPLRALPARYALLAFAAWATLSVAWSVDAGASFSKLRSDLYLPLGIYAAAFAYGRDPARHALLRGASLAGILVLAALSVMAWLPALAVDTWLPEENFGVIARPLPAWYPGVGDASMYAVLCLGPFLAWASLARAWRSPWTLVTAAALLVILLASENRNSLIVVALALLVFLALGGATPRARQAISRRGLLFIAVVCLASAGLATEVASRQRLVLAGEAPPSWGASAIELARRDPRPRMWHEYLHLGRAHALTGVGFGRTVPSEAYHTRADATLSSLDAAARSHAHNLFLNVWLQLGLVGLALLSWVMVALARALRHPPHGDSTPRPLVAGLAVLLVATLLRELSDDLLVFAMAAAFWCFAGLLFSHLREPLAGAGRAAGRDA